MPTPLAFFFCFCLTCQVHELAVAAHLHTCVTIEKKRYNNWYVGLRRHFFFFSCAPCFACTHRFVSSTEAVVEKRDVCSPHFSCFSRLSHAGFFFFSGSLRSFSEYHRITAFRTPFCCFAKESQRGTLQSSPRLCQTPTLTHTHTKDRRNSHHFFHTHISQTPCRSLHSTIPLARTSCRQSCVQ